jgi:hypothetical protein
MCVSRFELAPAEYSDAVIPAHVIEIPLPRVLPCTKAVRRLRYAMLFEVARIGLRSATCRWSRRAAWPSTVTLRARVREEVGSDGHGGSAANLRKARPAVGQQEVNGENGACVYD